MYGDGGYSELLTGIEQARMYMQTTDFDSFHLEPRLQIMSAARNILPGLAQIAGPSPEEIAWITELASRPPMLPIKGEQSDVA